MNKHVVICLGCWLVGLSQLATAAPKKEDVPDLIKALKTSKDPKVRAQAANDLAYLAQVRVTFVKPAVPTLIESLKTDSDAGVRKAVIDTLALVNADPKEVIPLFLDILKNDKEPNQVLQATASTLQVFGAAGKEALPHLQAIQKRENAKDEKQRDRNLLQSVNECIQILSK